MNPIVKFALAAVGTALLTACGSTSFNTTWTAPDAGPLKLEEGTKVLAMVVSGNTARRRGFETALVNELNESGLDGVAAFDLIPDEVGHDADKARPYIEKSGARYAVVLQVMGKSQEISSSPSMSAGMWGAPGAFWGPGMSNMGWGWNGGMDVRTDTFVKVQTLIYDLKGDQLVWAGESETMNPSKAESFVRELVRAVGNQLEKAGLIGD